MMPTSVQFISITLLMLAHPSVLLAGACTENITRSIELMRILNFRNEADSIKAGNSPLSPAFEKYTRNVRGRDAVKPMRGGTLKFKPGMENANVGVTLAEANGYLQKLDEIIGDRDSWIIFNLIVGQVIRERTPRMTSENKQLDAIRTVLMETAVALGFPPRFAITPGIEPGNEFDESFTDEQFKKMLATGLPFVDRAFPGRNQEILPHTSIVHFLQILFAESMLQMRPDGSFDRTHHMKTMMQKLLGNHALVMATTGNFPNGRPAGGYTSPWFNLFDAEGADTKQAFVPEWFGEMWHLVLEDIDYDLFLNSVPNHYGASHAEHSFPVWNQ